jgi:hypothetical protein
MTVSPHRINRLGSVAETLCVSCEVRTGYIYIHIYLEGLKFLRFRFDNYQFRKCYVMKHWNKVLVIIITIYSYVTPYSVALSTEYCFAKENFMFTTRNRISTRLHLLPCGSFKVDAFPTINQRNFWSDSMIL